MAGSSRHHRCPLLPGRGQRSRTWPSRRVGLAHEVVDPVAVVGVLQPRPRQAGSVNRSDDSSTSAGSNSRLAKGFSRTFGEPGGSQLHRCAVLRTVKWTRTGQGRRIHDLRHTAACLWLARGVHPGTVQAWMGHESIATTNRYLHFLGTSADRAGMDRLNDASRHSESRPGDRNEGRAERARGYAGGTRDSGVGESHP